MAVRREIQSVVLLLVGGALIKSGLDGTYVRYVRAGMLPFLLGTGVVLAAVGVLELARALQPAGAPASPGEAPEHEHGADVAWLLALPLLALLLLAPPPLGVEAASRNGTALGSGPVSSDYPPLPDGDPVRLTMLDYANRAVFEHGTSLGQRRVILTGFVIADGAGQRYLARMVISCCAADARPIKVGLVGNVPRNLPLDGWVEVTGRYSGRTTRDALNNEPIPYLEADAVSPIPAPTRPYES